MCSRTRRTVRSARPTRCADLRGRIPLQAQLDDRPIVGLQPAHHLLDGLGEDRRLQRRGLPVDRLAQPNRAITACRRVGLARRVSALGPVVFGPIQAFPHRDDRQQAPEGIPGSQVELPGPVASEEAPIDRLDDVFRVELAAEPGVELGVRQRDQPAGEAAEDLGGGAFVAGAEP